MDKLWIKNSGSKYKSPLESFLEDSLKRNSDVELITVEICEPSEDYFFAVKYQAHIFNPKCDVHTSNLINETILYLQPNQQLLESSLFEDEIFSELYRLENKGSKILFNFPVDYSMKNQV